MISCLISPLEIFENLLGLGGWCRKGRPSRKKDLLDPPNRKQLPPHFLPTLGRGLGGQEPIATKEGYHERYGTHREGAWGKWSSKVKCGESDRLTTVGLRDSASLPAELLLFPSIGWRAPAIKYGSQQFPTRNSHWCGLFLVSLSRHRFWNSVWPCTRSLYLKIWDPFTKNWWTSSLWWNRALGSRYVLKGHGGAAWPLQWLVVSQWMKSPIVTSFGLPATLQHFFRELLMLQLHSCCFPYLPFM